jgi:two-component system invasion response regulator UvrY
MKARVLIADDHAILRSGVRRILAEDPDILAVDEVTGGWEALRAMRKKDYEVLLLDIAMKQGSGLEVLEALRKRVAAPHVLILSMYPEKQYALRSIKLGADGYLTKDSLPEELLEAVHKVAAGGKYISRVLAEELAEELAGMGSGKTPHKELSEREFQVMRMLAGGMGLKEIANELKLSLSTVSTYRGRVMGKLGVRNTAGIIRYAVEHGLVE